MVGVLNFNDKLLDSVNVSWTPPAEPNGVIRAYRVHYRTIKTSGGALINASRVVDVKEQTSNTWFQVSHKVFLEIFYSLFLLRPLSSNCTPSTSSASPLRQSSARDRRGRAK